MKDFHISLRIDDEQNDFLNAMIDQGWEVSEFIRMLIDREKRYFEAMDAQGELEAKDESDI